MQPNQDVHAHQPVHRAGPAISDARLVAILLHGRGASADDILGLSREFTAPDVAYLAPQAAEYTWYPFSFLAPIEQNEPNLSSALSLIARLLQDLQQQNVGPERVVLLGFSQGACLALEFAARHAQRYAAVVALSGGLIALRALDAITQVDSMGPPFLWGAATSTHTFLLSVCTNRRRYFVAWAQSSMSASILAWVTQ
jgi:phospholipase/carboxylesterase